MPFETAPLGAKRIAVIGGGISGMGAAYELRHAHQVVLFESGPKLGGHARTVMAGKNGDLPVDTGFSVWMRSTDALASAGRISCAFSTRRKSLTWSMPRRSRTWQVA